MPFGGFIHILKSGSFNFFFHYQPSCFAFSICRRFIVFSFFYIEILSIARAQMLLKLFQLSYKADTLTIFPPAYSGDSGLSSPSGVVTGGVGMLIIAVVTYGCSQFSLTHSSILAFKLDRLMRKKID
jgi:hypothetical protein